MDVSHIPHIDKFAHFLMYFVLSFLLLFDLSKGKDMQISLLKRIFYTLLIVVFYGGGMEVMQLIPSLHRSTEWGDFFANACGAVTAVLLFLITRKVFRKLMPNYTATS